MMIFIYLWEYKKNWSEQKLWSKINSIYLPRILKIVKRVNFSVSINLYVHMYRTGVKTQLTYNNSAPNPALTRNKTLTYCLLDVERS